MADRFELDGNVTEAIKSAETALLARKALVGHESGEIAAEDGLLEPMHKQALALIQKCNGIAVGEFQNNRYDTSLFLLNKALFLTSAAADTNCFGMYEHDRLRLRAATLNNLGCLEKRRDNITEALDYLQSAVEIETLVDPDVGASPSTCLNLCTLFNKVGKHDDAVAAAERAITALHFQAQQGYENIPQFINMLMVAHYNMGVSVECTSKTGSIPKAIDAYSRAVDIHREHGKGLPNATAEAAAEALRRLRALQANYPVAMPHTAAAALPPIRRGLSAHRAPPAQNSYLKSLAPLGGGVLRPHSEQSPRPPPMHSGCSTPRPMTQPGSPARDAPGAIIEGGGSVMANRPLGTLSVAPCDQRRAVPVTSSVATIQRRSSLSLATNAVIESAAGLGSAAMKHASRMQAKARRKEEATERAAVALVKAQRAHRRDKETQQKRDEEQEARRRDGMAEVLYSKMVESMRTEEVRRAQHAACKITAIWRGYITRRYLLILTHCTIRIQAMIRSALCRMRLTAEREEARRQEVNAAITFKRTKAAVVLQIYARRFLRRLAIIRRYKARKMREYHSAKRIQEAFLTYRHRKQEAVFRRIEAERRQQELEHERIHQAACKIQGMYRAFKSRRFARLVRSEQQRRTAAAVAIQAQIRGCLTRQWFKHYRLFRREQEMSSAASIRCITRIQRVWRVALAKMRLQTLRGEALLHQRHLQLHRAALTIQCAYRCFHARGIVRPMRDRKRLEERSATRIASAYRGFKAREMYTYQRAWDSRQRAAICLQRWVRRLQTRVRERAIRRSGFQKRLAERAALKRTGAAMCIQAWCHTAITRRLFLERAANYLFRAVHVARIQSVGRMCLANRDMATLQRIAALVAMQEARHEEMAKCALVIQRKVREFQARSLLEERRRAKASAIVIQSAWRMHTARVRCDHLRLERLQAAELGALATLQRVGRGYLRFLELRRLEAYHLTHHRQKMLRLRREEAATQIQAQWRGVATRAAVNEARHRLKHTVIETMRIQRAWRAYKFRSCINAHVQYRVAQRLLREGAATRIQSLWRMVLAKEYVSLVREKTFYHTVCAITIQCAWRKHMARLSLEGRRRKREQHQQFLAVQHDGWVQAVDVISMHARTFLDQRLRLALLERYLTERVHHRERARVARINMAATRIQSRYRGYYERSYVRGLRKEHAERENAARALQAKRTKGAEVIQRAFRSMVARVAANTLRVERRIQSERAQSEREAAADPRDVVKQLFWQHEALIKKNLLKTQAQRQARLYNAASKIQSVCRMFLAKRSYRSELDRRRRLSAHEAFEKKLAAEADAQRIARERIEHSAAIRIQTSVRAFLARTAFRARVLSVGTRQAHALEDEEVMDGAAIKIQSAWRGYSARCLAQRLAFENNAQKDAIAYYEAARMIQKFYRGHVVRRRLGTRGVVRRRMSTLRSRPPSTSSAAQVPKPPSSSRPATSSGAFTRGLSGLPPRPIPPPALY